MGGIASKDSQTPEAYAEKARKVQELPNKILHILFSQTDFKDILSLSSLEACPTYVFTTANALEAMFQKLQIQPSKGKEGEIIFAPVSRLAPGLIASKESTAEQVERMKQRNRLCMDVAFFYVRVFQIYAALALTIMNTNPTRRVGYAYVPQKRKMAGPAPAPLFMSGGATAERGLRKQRKEFHWKDIYKQVIRTNFRVLENYFTFVEKRTTKKILLQFSVGSSASSAYGSFNIEWEPNQDVLLGTYIDKKTKTESRPVRVTVEVERYAGREVRASLLFDKDEIISFIPSSESGWVVEEGTTQVEKDRIFTDYIDSYFSDFREDVKEGRPVAQAVKPGVGAQFRPGGIAVSTSAKSPFHSFDDLKKLFESYHKGDQKIGDFPKAYCIARAMTLLNPIFEQERINQPYRSLVCNKTNTEEYLRHMPRAGTYANANIYLRSLVALSYEGYEYSNQQINLVQSAESRAELQNIGKRFARLYKISGDDSQTKDFLTSRVAFRDFPLCGKTDTNIQILHDGFRKKIQRDVVMPMLAFQDKHNQNALDLLKQMFEFQEGQLKFSKEIVKGGLKAINELAHKAFRLLTVYYLTSEGYFINGILEFENNRGKDYFTFYS